MENTYCVIMAGGVGSRFWPMSRTPHPKQFIDILGTGKTLLQQTAHRFRNICPTENILVVTNQMYKDLVLEQLPEINENQVLCEPARRNTAPCICYANHKIAAQNPNANIIVAPSDHLVLMEDAFEQTIKTALQQAANEDCLVTLGIKPSRPDTGYGYIQFNTNKNGISEQVKKIKTFTEKPEHDMAVEFIESGDFYWNSGIFIWSLQSISNAFENFLPDVNELFQQGAGKYNTPQETEFIANIYQLCPNISIDYGIMEKAENAFVVLSDFGWSDLGTWGSLYTHLEKDNNGNAVSGKNVFLYNSNNCIVNVPNEKLVVLQGLDDYIVAESGNILLVCRKQDEQKIKQFVTDIKAQKGDRFV